MRTTDPKGRSARSRALRHGADRGARGHARKPVGATRAEKSEARRQAIIAAALDEFCTRGFAATRLDNVVRLVMTEGPRFPQLAEFYYRNVVERAIAAMRALLTRAKARGELKDDTLIRFPQLIVAPGMMAIIWSGLFERFAPLDVAAMMRAHVAALLEGAAP